MWDEHAGDETNTEPRKYHVKVTGSATVSVSLTVTARNSAEAEELAEKQADKLTDHRFTIDSVDDLIAEEVRLVK